MKYILGIIAAIAFTSCQTEAQPKVIGQSQFSVDKEIHDYGTIEKGGDGLCIFTVTNTGDQPLIISKCDKSCGCTIPKCDPTPILPGASSEIEVTYDTKRIGPFTKSITVHCNDPDQSIKMLRIKGNVTDSELENSSE